MKSFDELIGFAKKAGKKRCVVVMAQDKTVLEGVKMAQDLNLILPVLVGNKDSILQHAKNVNLDLNNIEIHNVEDENEVIKKSISLVKEHGDFLMKGTLSTSAFLKGVLNKAGGLRTGKIVSHIAV